jgi:GTP pyrophosphokinase
VEAIARETVDIYAPLAHRLGMARIKWELEDLAFRYLYPEEYKSVVSKVVASRHERETVIEGFAAPLKRKLDEEKIEAIIVGRPKHFYSIYRKMQQRAKTFEEIYDLLAIRVIVETVRDCYHVLGVIHSLWTPLHDRFKDYISTPKSNGYQSLHTTVFGDKGQVIEVQIRTKEMNQVAEDGIAAHWLYKDGQERPASEDDRALSWLKNLIEWQKDLTDSSEFYEFFKIDLYDAEIFVFTPKGDLISLPKGATVLDFAFSVHTQLGLRCMGAKVDGKFEPISKVLKSGTTVEILHSSTKKPSLDWLREVKTPKARSAIRRWLKNTGRQESIELGKKIIAAAHKKAHSSTPLNDAIPLLLQFLGVNNLERLYELVGSGEMPLSRVTAYFQEDHRKKPIPTRVVSRLVSTFAGKDTGILVGGTDNIMVRFAKCCNPIPGDPITGFVTKGRGISIHRTDCENATLFADDRERTISVTWDDRTAKKYIVFLDIQAEDRPGLLHDITAVFLNFGVNVQDGRFTTTDNHVHNTFQLEIQNRNQLKQIFVRIKKIKGIEKISRTRDISAFM